MTTNNLLRATAQSGPAALAGLNADGTEVTWLERNWMFISWAFFLFGSGVLVALRLSSFYKKHPQLWYGWLSVVLYCLHQSEEHAYDLRGWRYAFVPALNLGPIRTFFQEICAEDDPSCPLDPKMTLYINTVAIWICFGGCMVAATIYPKFALVGPMNWGIAIVNGMGGHVVPAIVTQSYNPGVVQSIFMIPLGLTIVVRYSNPFLCLGMGIFFHAVLIASVQIIYKLHTPEALTCIVANMFSGLVVPLWLANYMHGRDLKKTK